MRNEGIVSKEENVLASVNASLTDLFVVMRGHDAVHPERSECGGLDGCALMRAEHDAGRSLIETLKEIARNNDRIRVGFIGNTC